MNPNAKEFVVKRPPKNNISLESKKIIELETIIKNLEARNAELEKLNNESIDALFIYEMRLNNIASLLNSRQNIPK